METEITDFIRDIAIGIASNKFQNSIDSIKFYHCSRKVIKEIDSAFNESLKDWVKLDVNKYSEIQIQTLIKENFLNDTSKTQSISNTSELQRFFQLFDYALSKRQTAFNFLTLKRNEVLLNEIQSKFKKIIQQNFENETILENTYNVIQDFRSEANSKLDLIYETITNEKNVIQFDKEDSKEYEELFIPSIKSHDSYISRLVIKSDSKQNIEFFEVDNEKKYSNLDKEILISNDALIILEGEPGIGKTIELNRVALSFWKSDETDLVPFYRNLRNFTIQDTIDSFLKVDTTEKFVNVLFILDGIDEIKDTVDFISKLNNFILNRRNRTSRFVLSCRSNILKKLSRTIEGGAIYRLKNLNVEESIALFENLVNVKCDETEKSKIIKSSFIGDPFRIKLLADFYVSKGAIENDEYKLWSHYIQKSLTIDEEVKFAKKEVFALQILEDSKKSATVHELMNQFVMDREIIYKILEKDQNRLEQFTNSSLVDKESVDNKFLFNHRKVQECLTAMFLSDLSIENISKLCQVPQSNIIKPQLENTILLLISTLSSSPKIKDLLIWIKENNPELLFKADLNLFSQNERTSLFKNYYIQQCLEKTLWLGTNKSISDKDLAQFADSLESFHFLIDIINNKELNHRARISAMNLIEEFKTINEDNLISTIQGVLDSDENISFKSVTVRLLNVLSNEKRKVFFRKIIELYSNESNAEWNRSLIAILEELDNIDEFFVYFKKEFNWANNIVPRDDNDDVHRGNSWIIMGLVLKLNDESNFIDLVSFYFDDYYLRNREIFKESIIKKCLDFENKSPGFVVKLLLKIKKIKKISSFQNNETLIELIKRSNNELDAFKILYSQDLINDVDLYTFSKITTKETIDYFVNNIKSEEVNKVNLQLYRNIVASYVDRNLAFYLEEQLSSKGVYIEDKLQTQEEVNLTQEKLTLEVQENADLIFDNVNLLKKIKSTLSITNKEMINIEVVRKFERLFYDDKKNWFKGFDFEFNILYAAFNFYDSFTLISLKRKLNDNKWIQLTALKSMLESNKSAFYKFEFSKLQIEIIKEWITETSKSFVFHDLIVFDNYESFNVNRLSDYKFLKIFYYFLENDLFSDSFCQDFLLNSILYYRIEEYDPSSVYFNKLLEKINSEASLKSKVIDFIKTKPISSSMEKLVVCALNNNYTEVYSEIEDFLKLSSHTPGDLIFDLYLEKNYAAAINLIEKIAEGTNLYKVWGALKVLSDDKYKSKHDYCIEKSINYLESGQKEFKSKALSILFKLNHHIALDYFIEGIGENTLQSIAHKYKVDYSVSLENFLLKIDNMFIFIYRTKEVKDEFNRDWEFTENHTFFCQLMTNVLKESENIMLAFEQLKRKLQDIIKENNDDRIIFFANSIIELLSNNYIDLMSKPLDFDEAHTLANQLLT